MKSTFANKEFPPSRRTRRSAGRWSDALKDPRIRRAVSTLVYATPLHPAQRHLPVNLHPPISAVFWAGGLAGACRRRPCWSRFNRQDDHPRSCSALLCPQGHDHPLGCRHLHVAWRCPSTPPRPTSWWQQQRSVVLTQRAGLLFTRYPFLLRTQVAHATRNRKPKPDRDNDRSE